MVRHVVVFRWAPGTTPAQVARVEAALGALPAQIPELRSYHFGRDLGLVDGNADFAVVADCDDATAWRAYIDHPAHQAALADHIKPLLGERTALQFEVPDPG